MTSSSPSIHGFCLPRFDAVRDEFRRNFVERGEVGAAVSLWHDGECVADLWGGLADQETQRPWERDTLALVFSSTKGLAAICMHILADRGLLDFDAPVAQYWPEFAAHGKAGITVAMVVSHQAGLPFWEETLPDGAFHDWDLVAGLLAEQAPIWEPGTTHGYHGVTLGYMEGEIVRRITGKSIGRFLHEEVAAPLNADIWIGLPEAEEARVATLYLGEPSPLSPLFQKLMSDETWVGWKLISNNGGDMESVNTRARHAAEVPAAGGIVSARGLAKAYAPLSLDGSLDGVRIVSPQRLPGMRAVRSASDCDFMLQVPTTFTLGFSKSWGARRYGQGEHVILGEHAFGTVGLGGSLGFADGDAGLAFGYAMNRHGGGVGLNDRGQSLVDAAYRAVGYTSSAPGFWVRG